MTSLTALEQSPRDQKTTKPQPLSPRRLNLLRVGYGVIAVGLALTRWPLLVNHPQPWPLFEGVVTSMLVALSLLFFLGLRYPVQMLPILLFEAGWKLVWTASVFVPLALRGQLDAATVRVFENCLVVVIPLAVMPWGLIVAQYVTKPGERWRSPRDVVA